MEQFMQLDMHSFRYKYLYLWIFVKDWAELQQPESMMHSQEAQANERDAEG
jgi:hypothetical protein